MRSKWEKIESFLERGLPELRADLNEGCNPEAWAGLEEEAGVDLPEPFKRFYAVHDGQRGEDGAPGLLFGLQLLPGAEVYERWKGWRDLIDSMGEAGIADMSEFCVSLVPGKVKETYANKLWIPFAHDWGGNHLGLDFDPGANGVAGQVINFGRDEDEKFVLADSFEEFVGWFVGEIERGNCVVRLTEEGVKTFEIKEPPIGHFIDAARRIFAG